MQNRTLITLGQEEPLRRAKQALRGAKAAFEQMGFARSLEEFGLAWQSVLERLEKVWVKVERECQAFRAQFEPWQSRYKTLRSSDELLQYLYQARHVDQHSIQPTVLHLFGRFQFVIPPLGTIELQLDAEKGHLVVRGECSVSLIEPPGLVLLPITNRGVTYQPPTRHLGQQWQRSEAILAAEKGIEFYEDFLQQAETRFFPKANLGDAKESK